jgi:Flp pilus assembly protein TadG
MIRRWLSIQRIAQGFKKDCAGNVITMFGFSLLPLAAAVGFAFDYSRISAARAKLDNAADVATLASISKNANPFVNTPTQSGVRQWFDAAATQIPGVTITSFQANIAPSVTNMAVTVTYTAQVQTTLGAILGISSVSVGGTSTAKTNAPPYVDFYLLLDNSPSMGLGATAADITHLQQLTPDSCAFACHQHTFDSNGNITGDNTSDYYHVARNNGVTLRIDVLRTATQKLTQTASASETVANQFRMAVNTFSDTFQTVASLSADMPSVSTSANAIDLAYAYRNQRDAQTSFDTALSYMNSTIPNPGSGAGQTTPQEFLFLVTDGVEDEPVGSASGSGDPADPPASYLPLNNQPNLANTQTGNVNSGRLIDMIKADSSSMCTTIKNRGIKIAVLYTPYMPVTNNAFYNKWIGATSTSLNNNNPVNANDPTDPAQNGIGIALKTCASPGFYYQVTPTTGINDAMQALFQAAITSVLLTN